MLGLTELILIVIVFGSFLILIFFLAWYFFSRAKVKDKQFLIEKGIDPNDPRFKTTLSFSWLKLGIVIIGISLAFFLIAIINLNGLGSPLNLPIILLFAGLSMIVANYIGK